MINTAGKYAKNTEYQRKNYDQICIRVGKGQRDFIADLAAEDCRTVANYIKHLIIQDAQKKGKNPDVSAFLGGGGENLTKKIMKLM